MCPQLLLWTLVASPACRCPLLGAVASRSRTAAALRGWLASRAGGFWMLLHFDITVAVAEPLTGPADGFVLPLPLGTCLGKPEWCLPPWDEW